MCVVAPGIRAKKDEKEGKENEENKFMPFIENARCGKTRREERISLYFFLLSLFSFDQSVTRYTTILTDASR